MALFLQGVAMGSMLLGHGIYMFVIPMPPAQSLDHSRARYTEGTDSILKFGVIW
jgi:hypothetical protein